MRKLVLFVLILGLMLGGCGELQKSNSTLSEVSLVFNGKEIKTSMKHDQIKGILGQPSKTDQGYFFNNAISTDYYDSDNILIRFTNTKFNNISTDEIVSILVLGGEGKTTHGIKVGESLEAIYSTLGKKNPAGYRSSNLYYLDYGAIFYYNPADNKVIRFTLPGPSGTTFD